jgi:hypothetical protein
VYFLPHVAVLLMVAFAETVGRAAVRKKRERERETAAKAAKAE